jgi:N-acetyl-anhydromuramyl-L-alanine amidase AmpD
MPTMGVYREGYPEGALIHYTAARSSKGLNDAFAAMDWGKKEGYAFLTIASNGQLVQGHPINEWGYHAGQSFWPGLGKSLSSRLIGIEICSAGKLEPQKDGTYMSWYGEKFTDQDVRYVGKSYGCDEGFYHKFTLEQEQALWALLVFLKENDPKGRFKFENVLGHHEVTNSSTGRRKLDPGGSFSIPMELLRRALKFHREIDSLEGFTGWDL